MSDPKVIILGADDGLQATKQEIPNDVQKAVNAIFYIGDTGLDGRLVAHIAGNMHSVVSLLVNAGHQNDTIRKMLLVTAEHLK